MKPNLQIKTNYIGWLIILVAIAMLYLGYFFIYIPQQETRVKERGFRILKEYGSNMHGKYAYYQKHIDNYGFFYSMRHILKSKGNTLGVMNYKNKNPEIIKLINGLDKTIIADTSDHSSVNPYEQYKDKKAFYLHLISHNEVKNTLSNKDSVSLVLTNKDMAFFPNKKGFYKVPITTLMQGLKFDQLLDNIVLFDDSTVFYNSNRDIIQDITSPGALSDSSSYHQGGVFETIEVRGEKKHLMIIPINFLGKEFYLAGFIPDSEFKKKTRTINSQLLIIISGILLLILIGMPVLKIIFISPKEALRVNDARGATMSMILSIGLLILIVISTLKHYVADRVILQKRVAEISDTIYHNVETDFDSVISLYHSIIDSIDTDTTKLAGFARKNFLNNNNFQQIPVNLLNDQIPVNEIILIDSNGIVSQAVTRTPFSNIVQIDLSERLYFKNVMDQDKSWILKNRISNEPSKTTPLSDQYEKYYFESIKSYNTGYHETAVSFRLKKNTFDSLASILAITSHIPSLYDQILPKDIEFVVINEEGHVLYHSIESKNLHENFLDEVNAGSRLIGAIHHRVNETLEITYNEKQWLARVIPLADMPLYHITLLDLQQTQNKNARIFLFTFYFLLITFLCILIGIRIMHSMNKRNGFISAKSGTLTWLFFQETKLQEYKVLLQVQSLIIICQFTGFYFNDNPVIVLLYQLIFIGFSGFAALAVLGGRKDPFRNFFQKFYFSTSLILIIIAFLILFLKVLQAGFIFYFSIITLGLLSVFIHYISKKYPDNQTPSVAHDKPDTMFVKKVFLSYMFLWLVSFSVIPVVHYYYSIKKQEEKLWQRDQMEQVAHKNLLLKKNLEKSYKDIHAGKWYQRIQGNGIDSLKITVGPCMNDTSVQKRESPRLSAISRADSIYSRLPDPVTKSNELMSLLRDENFLDEWRVDGQVLCYSRTENENQVQVVSSGRKKFKAFKWLLYFSIPILLISLFVWYLNRYMVKHLFFTLLADWVRPKIPSWDGLMSHKKIDRILLISINGNKYRKKLSSEKEDGSGKDKQIPEPKLIQAEDLLSPKSDVKTFVSKKEVIIWIIGSGDYLLQIEKAKLLVESLIEISQTTKGKLIIELPYGLDYLDEYYEDYQTENELEKTELLQISSLKRSLTKLFKDYYRYPGTFIHETDDNSVPAEYELYNELIESESKMPYGTEEQLIGIQSGMELRYTFIWNNLTKMEKMTLYDLADDGMLNFKNKILINQLERKGLINLKPVPRLFAESFQYFLLFSIDPEEKHTIEQKLNRHSKWRNKRYLILLILVLLAGFVFIAQGSSIEKVIGILTGSLAVFSGVTRLIDSNVFRAS